MTDYFLRCKQSDYALMVSHAETLGLITVIDGKVYGSGWLLVNENGKVYRGTGQFDAEGNEIKTLLVDENGIPYVHVNIRTDVDLKARAIEQGLLAELEDLGRFFVVDAEGKPKRPSQPELVYF